MSTLALAVFGFLAIPATVSQSAQANQIGDGIAIMCDPVKFRFSIRANATTADLDRGYPIAKIVSVDGLFFKDGLPGETGEIDVKGPLVRYERCGPYTFRLEGAAFNMNVQGESGAYDDFASVSILRGAGAIYPYTSGTLRLTTCDRQLPRAQPCPEGYAVRLDGRYNAGRKVLELVETTTSFEDDADRNIKTVTRHFEEPDDLQMWHPE